MPEAIESALSQTHGAPQVVVVDDGSTDSTDTEIRSYYEQNPRITWIRQNNAGQLAAFQTAIAAATGDICFFLDADDYYEPDYVELMLAYYAKHPSADFVFSEPCKFEGAKGNPPITHDPKSYDYGISVIREVATKRFIGRPTSALTCKRATLNTLFPFSDSIVRQWKICADECLVHGAGLIGANKHYYGIQRVNYRIHGNNLYQSDTDNKLKKYQRKIILHSFFNYMRERFHLGHEHLSLAEDELATIPHPRQKDIVNYRAIATHYRKSCPPSKLRILDRIKLSLSKRLRK